MGERGLIMIGSLLVANRGEIARRLINGKVDGVRMNQPFGDVVSWDLIPRVAISTITLARTPLRPPFLNSAIWRMK